MIKLFINGKERIVACNRLLDLLNSTEQMESIKSKNFVVAVNQNFIAKTDYAEIHLRDQDHIELFMPMQGG